MPTLRSLPSRSGPSAEGSTSPNKDASTAPSGNSKVGTYDGPAPISALMSDAQGGQAQGQTRVTRQGQGAIAEEFDQSDEDKESDEDDSDDSEKEENRQAQQSVTRKRTAERSGKKKRVTLLLVEPSEDDKGDVAYPRLRLSHGRDSSAFSRRVSCSRAEYAASDLELAFFKDAHGNPTSSIIIYTDVGERFIHEDSDNLLDTVEDKHQLVKSVAKYPDAWFAVINKYTDYREALSEEIEERAEETQALQEIRDICEKEHGHMEDRMGEAERTISQARETVARLRTERSDARRDSKAKASQLREQEKVIASLQEALNEAQRPVKKAKKHRMTDFEPSEGSSSDESEGRREVKREYATPASATPGKESEANSHNPRYPDISNYHGKSSEDLEQWTAAADTKFARSWANFPTEWSKIEYLRDHCKDTAYSVVKLRSLRRSENPYQTAEQLINDLEMNFGMSNEDRKAAALQKLTGGDCKQKQNEGASEWLARYNLTATEAQLDQATRRFYALQNLNSSYKTSATQNARTGESWSEFCARLRQLEKDIAAAYGNGSGNGNNNKDKKKDGKSDKGGKTSRDNNYHRPKEQFKIIMEKKLCARCLKPGHIPSSPDAPCRDKKMATWDKSLELHAADTESQQEGGVALKE